MKLLSSKGRTVLVDRDVAIRLGGRALTETTKGYIYVWDENLSKQRHLHSWLLNLPIGEKVDHKDGNPLNNQRSNLRRCSQKQNRANSRKYRNNTSGFKGVRRNANSPHRWIATIQKRYIGSYSSAAQAAKAYDSEAVKTFGVFANLNFPKN
jgi:hypothetical protein